MTKDRDFKDVVRARMARTGEPYTAAREGLAGDDAERDALAPRRILGLETRYSATGAFVGARQVSQEEIARWMFRRVVSWGRSSNVYLQNGARLYLVGDGVMEYATPECDSAEQVVAQVVSGDRRMTQLRDGAGPILDERGIPARVLLSYDDGPGGGSHESYLARLPIGPHLMQSWLIPFLVTRQLFSGVGIVLPLDRGALFALSPRAEHVWSSAEIVELSDAPFAAGFGRIHVRAGDANSTDTSTFLKVATTGLVVRLMEERGDALPKLTLENPVRTVREVSHDPTGNRSLTLASGHTISAVDLQFEVLAQAKALLADEPSTAEDRRAVPMWEHVLSAVQRGDRRVLDGHTEWALKLSAIESGTAQLDEPYAFQIDKASRLVNPLGTSPPGLDDAPQTTRARLRSEFIKACTEARRDYTVDWTHLKLNDQAQRTIVLKDPFVARDPRVDKLIGSIRGEPQLAD